MQEEFELNQQILKLHNDRILIILGRVIELWNFREGQILCDFKFFGMYTGEIKILNESVFIASRLGAPRLFDVIGDTINLRPSLSEEYPKNMNTEKFLTFY